MSHFWRKRSERSVNIPVCNFVCFSKNSSRVILIPPIIPPPWPRITFPLSVHYIWVFLLYKRDNCNSLYSCSCLSKRSSIFTPTYFNFVNMDNLEYTFMHISAQFLDQVRSSESQTANSLVTRTFSRLTSFMFIITASYHINLKILLSTPIICLQIC